MDNKNTILTELYQISPVVAKIGDAHPYSPPPADFFDNLPILILNRIRTEQRPDAAEELTILSPVLATIGKKSPYTVPEGYFQELPGGLIAGARAIDEVNEELDLHASVIGSIRKENVYRVPRNYFKDLPDLILSRVSNREPAKLVSIGFSRKLAGYAAAAVVTGLLIVGGIVFMNKQTVTTGERTLASFQQANDTISGINKISETEMVNYLENESFPLADAAYSTAADITDDDLKDMLQDVSDETLQQYLVQYNDARLALVN